MSAVVEVAIIIITMKNKTLFMIFFHILLTWKHNCVCFHHRSLTSPQFKPHVYTQRTSPMEASWSNSNYTTQHLNQLWNESPKQLLTIGISGTKHTHINSLKELLDRHRMLIVKFSTDKININEEIEKICHNDTLKDNVELLQVRWKSFLIRLKSTIRPFY